MPGNQLEIFSRHKEAKYTIVNKKSTLMAESIFSGPLNIKQKQWKKVAPQNVTKH